MIQERRIKIIAIIAIILLFVSGELFISFLSDKKQQNYTNAEQKVVKIDSVKFFAFGDINLGRTVGKKILSGDTLFPFKRFQFSVDANSIVFANLESQLSEQKGETEHPQFNMIFTGPPAGAKALKFAGVTVVSTANNHAFDYGKRALKETIENLEREEIYHIGTTVDKKKLYSPLIIKKNNIKFAIFAVTEIMNSEAGWKGFVAFADTAQLFPQVREVKDSVDIIVLSFHGGTEYSNLPSKKVKQFAQESIAQGVSLFLGHHPHVTYGIEALDESFAIHSLGNFVFYQPQGYWNQRSYGVEFLITKSDLEKSKVQFNRIIPVEASLQPKLLTDSVEIQKLINRTQKLSNITIQ